MVFSTSANYVPFAIQCGWTLRRLSRTSRGPKSQLPFFIRCAIVFFTLVALNPCCLHDREKKTVMSKERENADKCSCFEQLPKVSRSTLKQRMKGNEQNSRKKMTNTNCLWYANNCTILLSQRLSVALENGSLVGFFETPFKNRISFSLRISWKEPMENV